MLNKKRVLVTGATGFVGANLTRWFLTQGADVFVFIRKTSDLWRIADIRKRIKEFAVDLNNLENTEKAVIKIIPQVIIHTAAYGGSVFQDNIDKIIESNFVGTVNLVRALKAINYEAMINTGSSSEYGIYEKPMSENDLLRPVSEYGVSKAAGTLFCQAEALKHNRPIATLRLFSPYGYYDEPNRLISSVILSGLKRKIQGLSSPNSVRDFVFIEDVIEAYRKAIININEINGEIINIGAGQQYSVGEVVSCVNGMFSDGIKFRWGAIPNNRDEPKHWQADIAKAAKVLSWKPKYKLKLGIKKCISWFEKNMDLYK